MMKLKSNRDDLLISMIYLFGQRPLASLITLYK